MKPQALLILALADSLRVTGLDGVIGVTAAASAAACWYSPVTLAYGIADMLRLAGAVSVFSCRESTAISASGVADVVCGSSATVDWIAVSVSSSGCAGTVALFELFGAFLACFCFLVILFPPWNPQKYAC
jgi:hypothetical protein